MTPAYWLASYPKSGNTWFRLLLANLRTDVAADINALPSGGGIASARATFDDATMIPSGLLTHEECDRLRPLLYRARDTLEFDARDQRSLIDGKCFTKVHDGYTRLAGGVPLLGGAEAADGVILIVRDPRDIASSLAAHNGTTVDEAIAFMADAGAMFCAARDRQVRQLRQRLLGWSASVASWLDQPDVPVHLVRYEDMLADTAGTLAVAIRFAGIDANGATLSRAIAFAAFDALRDQERDRGFREASRAAQRAQDASTVPPSGFFRRGTAGGWRDDLDVDQIARIERDHAPMMRRLGYALAACAPPTPAAATR